MSISRRQFIAKSAIVGLGSAAFATSKAASSKVTLKLTYPDVRSHPFYEVGQHFADAVREKTAGAVDIRIFTLGELGSGVNILTGLQTGTIDLCAHTTGFIGRVLPQVQGLDLPFLFDDVSIGDKVVDGPVGSKLLGLLKPKRIYGLSWGTWAPRVTETVSKPVTEPSAMKGLRIRVQPGAIYEETFKVLGAIPVAMELTEVYLGLSQKTIDATEVPMISVAAGKNYEVLKSVTKTDHTYNAGIMMASQARFDRLKPAYQDAIRTAAVELTPYWRSLIKKRSEEAEVFLKGKGLSIHDADKAAYKKAVEPVYKEFRNKITPEFYDELMAAVSAARA